MNKEKNILKFQWDDVWTYKPSYENNNILEKRITSAAYKACEEYSYEMSDLQNEDVKNYLYWFDDKHPDWYSKCLSEVQNLFMKYANIQETKGVYFHPKEYDDYDLQHHLKYIDFKMPVWLKNMHKHVSEYVFAEHAFDISLIEQGYGSAEGMREWISELIAGGMIGYYRRHLANNPNK